MGSGRNPGDGEEVPSEATPKGPDLGGREVNPVLTFSNLVELLKAARKREEGQTMAEYAVVLAVITVATVAVFTALSGGISGAINSVTGIL
jgi:Flp pilus assembly pilin Flp